MLTDFTSSIFRGTQIETAIMLAEKFGSPNKNLKENIHEFLHFLGYTRSEIEGICFEYDVDRYMRK